MQRLMKLFKKKTSSASSESSNNKTSHSTSEVRLAKFSEIYLLGNVLGQGSFGNNSIWRHSKITGIVQEAIHIPSGTSVAVKSIPKSTSSIQKQKIKNEISTVQTLVHPNIVQFKEMIEDGQYIRLVSELCKGGELFERIIEKGTYTEDDAISIVKQILSGVNYLHDHHIAHRDLKPENLLFKDKGKDSTLMVNCPDCR